jgi:hypothetical protein
VVCLYGMKVCTYRILFFVVEHLIQNNIPVSHLAVDDRVILLEALRAQGVEVDDSDFERDAAVRVVKATSESIVTFAAQSV